MSANHLPKISSKAISLAIVTIVLLGLTALNARVILENVLHSKETDELIVSEANPRLNPTLLQEAVKTLEGFSEGDLTSIPPSVTLEKELATEPLSVEIQNASGIDGAAASVAEILTQRGYQISALSTAPSLQNQTTIFHKAGRAEESLKIKEILEKEGWIVESIKEDVELKSEIKIVLGK